MSEIQDKVLRAIKEGYTAKREIIKQTGLSLGTTSNSLRALRKWKIIETDHKGNYKVIG